MLTLHQESSNITSTEKYVNDDLIPDVHSHRLQESSRFFVKHDHNGKEDDVFSRLPGCSGARSKRIRIRKHISSRPDSLRMAVLPPRTSRLQHSIRLAEQHHNRKRNNQRSPSTSQRITVRLLLRRIHLHSRPQPANQRDPMPRRRTRMRL